MNMAVREDARVLIPRLPALELWYILEHLRSKQIGRGIDVDTFEEVAINTSARFS